MVLKSGMVDTSIMPTTNRGKVAVDPPQVGIQLVHPKLLSMEPPENGKCLPSQHPIYTDSSVKS